MLEDSFSDGPDIPIQVLSKESLELLDYFYGIRFRQFSTDDDDTKKPKGKVKSGLTGQITEKYTISVKLKPPLTY